MWVCSKTLIFAGLWAWEEGMSAPLPLLTDSSFIWGPLPALFPSRTGNGQGMLFPPRNPPVIPSTLSFFYSFFVLFYDIFMYYLFESDVLLRLVFRLRPGLAEAIKALFLLNLLSLPRYPIKWKAELWLVSLFIPGNIIQPWFKNTKKREVGKGDKTQ